MVDRAFVGDLRPGDGNRMSSRTYPMQRARKIAGLTSLVVLLPAVFILLFTDFDLLEPKHTLLLWLLPTAIWAIDATVGLVEKLTTGCYEDGLGVHRREEDPVTYGYLVAFNVLGILVFIGCATLAIIRFT